MDNEICAVDATIPDSGECRTASTVLTKQWGGKESDSNYPKGCYLTSEVAVYWNDHSTGAAQSVSQPICKNEGK